MVRAFRRGWRIRLLGRTKRGRHRWGGAICGGGALCRRERRWKRRRKIRGGSVSDVCILALFVG